ncbi:hypothetical protein BG005_001964 [Podila minutissima]|nr:hypothetical protein BG005_001964 [Podila minutissima]
MKTFLKPSLLVVALTSADAAPAEDGCVPGTIETSSLANGTTEYSCTKDKRRINGSGQSEFGTNLFVSTSEGRINVSVGGIDLTFLAPFYGFRYSGYIDSAFGTSRSVVYSIQKTIDKVDKLAKACSHDGAFCLDLSHGVCKLFFSNRVWESLAPIPKAIQLSVNPYMAPWSTQATLAMNPFLLLGHQGAKAFKFQNLNSTYQLKIPIK